MESLKRKISRRDFLRLTALGAASGVLTACAPQKVAPQTPDNAQSANDVNSQESAKTDKVVEQFLFGTFLLGMVVSIGKYFIETYHKNIK